MHGVKAIDIEQLRRDEFAWMNSADTVYMNAASTGPSPRRSVEAQVDFVRRRTARMHGHGSSPAIGIRRSSACATSVSRSIRA